MPCEEKLVVEGWLEHDFPDTAEGAQQANKWYQEKNTMIRTKFAGLCERGCKEDFEIDVKSQAVPWVVGGGNPQDPHVTITIKFRVTCK